MKRNRWWILGGLVLLLAGGGFAAKKRGPKPTTVEVGTVRPYAEIRDRLKRAGTPIPSNDLWIAALAVQHRLPVVSRDTHFDQVRTLTRISW